MQTVEESLYDINLFLNNTLESVLNSDSDGYKERVVSLLEDISKDLSERKSEKQERQQQPVQSFENLDEDITKKLKDSTKDMSDVVSYMNIVNADDITLFSDKIEMLSNAFMSLEDLNIGKMNKLDKFFQHLQKNLNVLDSIKSVNDGEIEKIYGTFEKLSSLNDVDFNFLDHFNESLNDAVVAEFSTSITNLVSSLSKIKPITEEQFDNIATVNEASALIEEINAEGLSKVFSDLATNKISPKKVERARENLTSIFNVFNIDAENSITAFSEMLDKIDYKGLQNSAKSLSTTINSFSTIDDKGIADLDIKFTNINDSLSAIGNIDMSDGLKGVKRLIKSLTKTDDFNNELVEIISSTKKLGDNITTISNNLGDLENIEKIGDFGENFNNVVDTLSDMNKRDFTKTRKALNNIISSLDGVDTSKLRDFNSKVDKIYSSFTRFPEKDEIIAFSEKMNSVVENLTSFEKADLRKTESSINDILKSFNNIKDKNIEIFTGKTKSLTEAFNSIAEAKNIGNFSENFKTITDTLSSIDKRDIKDVKKTINNVVDYLKDANVSDFSSTITSLAESLNVVNNADYKNSKENLSSLIETYASIDKNELKQAVKNLEGVKDIIRTQEKTDISTKLSEKYSQELLPIEHRENIQNIEPRVSENKENNTISEKLDKLIDLFSENQKQLLNSIQNLAPVTVEQPVKNEETTETKETEGKTETNYVINSSNNGGASGFVAVVQSIDKTNRLLEDIMGSMLMVSSKPTII